MSDRICVGAVAGAFGVRGEARVKSFCAEPGDIAGYSPLTTEDGRQFDLKITRPIKDGFAARLSGVATREDAENMRRERDEVFEQIWSMTSMLFDAAENHDDATEIAEEGQAAIDAGM